MSRANVDLTNLRVRREALGLSQLELAKLVGVTPLTIYYWENSNVHPLQGNVDALEKVLKEFEEGGKSVPSAMKTTWKRAARKGRDRQFANLTNEELEALITETTAGIGDLRILYGRLDPATPLQCLALKWCGEFLDKMQREAKIRSAEQNPPPVPMPVQACCEKVSA